METLDASKGVTGNREAGALTLTRKKFEGFSSDAVVCDLPQPGGELCQGVFRRSLPEGS